MRGRALPLLALACAGCGDNAASPVPDARVDAPAIAEVLIYTRTLGYRHADAIEAGVATLPARLLGEGLTSEVTEDPAAFADLTGRRAVIFFYTSGNDILDPDGKATLEAFVRDGGGWLGVHSAADTEYLWPFYQLLVVAPFFSHPVIQEAAIDIADRAHPAMAVVPEGRWIATDEWYDFGRQPREVAGVRVLATLDETTYEGGLMGADHPIIWAHDDLGGRAFYTALGHVAARWQEPTFVDHVTAAVRWVARR